MISLKTYEVDDSKQKRKKAPTVSNNTGLLNNSPEKIIAVKTTKFLIH